MKKYIAITLLAISLLVAGCGKQTTATPVATAEPTAASAPVEPESVPGKVLIPHLGAVLGTVPLGEQVSIISMEDDYYLADTSAGQGLIEKRLLRLAGEPEFESFTGYAKSGAALYKGYRLIGSGAPLDINTKLLVLQAFDGGFLVRLDGETGYIASEFLSQTPVATGGDWSGDSGGSSGGSGGSSSGGTDGGDISLTAAHGATAHVRLLTNNSLATVLVDNAEVYAAFLNRDDSVKVTKVTDEECTIYMDGSFLTVPRRFVQLENDVPFESYSGYANRNAAVYVDYTMSGKPVIELETNREITVLGDFGRCCLVDVDGKLGFMSPDSFGKQPFYQSYDYGGGDGGNSGGGSGAADNWTPPVL